MKHGVIEYVAWVEFISTYRIHDSDELEKSSTIVVKFFTRRSFVVKIGGGTTATTVTELVRRLVFVCIEISVLVVYFIH